MTGRSLSRSITTTASPRCLEPGRCRAQVSAMKRCILDGATLPDAAAVYRKLAEDLDLPVHFGHNPDALWDALGERRPEPVEIVWRDSARSAERLGPAFDKIVSVLRRAAAKRLANLDLA